MPSSLLTPCRVIVGLSTLDCSEPLRPNHLRNSSGCPIEPKSDIAIFSPLRFSLRTASPSPLTSRILSFIHLVLKLPLNSPTLTECLGILGPPLILIGQSSNSGSMSDLRFSTNVINLPAPSSNRFCRL